MGIKENYSKIQKDISGTRIVAVTKYVDADKIAEAYQLGIRDFGEGKVQDAKKKRAQLSEEINKEAIWHFLGHIQTNKAKKIIGNFEYIHSVDSIKLAELISNLASLKQIKQKIFIQVNIAEEKTKYGFETNELKENFGKILSLNSLEIVGLMAMAPFTKDIEIQRNVFKRLRELRNYLQTKYKTSIPELSMGMSNDYKIACEEGATIVRIGQAIFNEN